MLTTPLPSSRFIGRVGLLAATLGVGFALVAAPGVAFADETGSDGGTSSSDSKDSASSSDSANDDKPTSTTPASGDESDSPKGEKTDKTENSESTEPAKAPDETPVDVPQTPAAGPKEPEAEHDGNKNRPVDTGPVVKRPTTSVPDTTPVARSVEGSDPAPATVGPPEPAPVVAAPAVVVEAAPAPPPEVVAPVDDAVAAAPSRLPAPAPIPAPVANPLEWALLGWVRRQSEQQDSAEAVALVGISSLVDNQAPEFDTPEYDDPDADGVVNGAVSATDPEGGTVTYGASALPSRGFVTVSDDGAFSYTPSMDARIAASRPDAPEDAKFDRFSITATDELGAAATIEVVVPIKPVYFDNTAPVIDGDPVVNQPGAGGVVTGQVVAHDPDGDPLSYSATSSKGTIVFGPDGSFTYTPTDAERHAAGAPDAAATGATVDTFLVTVTDDRGEMAGVTVQVAISPANVAPVFGTPTIDEPNAQGAVTGRINVSDADGDVIVVLGSGTPGKGTVVVRPDGTFTYMPYAGARHAAAADTAASAAKEDRFTVTVTDRYGAIVTTQVTVPVAPANIAPVYAGGGNTANANGTVSGTVRFVDPDGDRVTYTAGTRTTAKGVVTVNPDGSYTYRSTQLVFNPFNSSARTDTFTVTARDGYGGVSTTVVSVTIPKPVSTGGGGAVPNLSTPPAPPKVSTVVQSSNEQAAERQQMQREVEAAERLLKDLQSYMLWREAHLTRSPNDPAVLDMVNSVFATNFPGLDLPATAGPLSVSTVPPGIAPGGLAAAVAAAASSSGTPRPIGDSSASDLQRLTDLQARQTEALEQLMASVKQVQDMLKTITEAQRETSGTIMRA